MPVMMHHRTGCHLLVDFGLADSVPAGFDSDHFLRFQRPDHPGSVHSGLVHRNPAVPVAADFVRQVL